MNVEILASGSSGNCAVIDKTIIIDMGANVSPEGKYVLLTHHHTDHTKHLDKVGGKPIYCTQETADRLVDKLPYTAFNCFEDGKTFRLQSQRFELNFVTGDMDVEREVEYFITPVAMKHDAPCVGFDIVCVQQGIEVYNVFFATDFNEIENVDWIVKGLRDKRFDAIYIECNNTLSPADFHDVYFHDGDKPPRDEFHRRKSFQNHCNADYLISLFRRAGYSEQNRFAEPVTLLHKSSFYYQQHVERIAELAKLCNVVNPLY